MKVLLNMSASVLAASVLLSVFPSGEECAIYDDVIRLHVIAASDSEEDQALKLKVRDAVLDCVEEALSGCGSYEEALTTVTAMEDEIAAAAESCVAENGGTASVHVSLGREDYPRRDYGSATLPAGTYTSLRVILDEGEGQNWWCVLFPTVCVRFADAGEAEYVAAGFTPREYQLISGGGTGWKIRFRVLEILSDLFGLGNE